MVALVSDYYSTNASQQAKDKQKETTAYQFQRVEVRRAECSTCHSMHTAHANRSYALMKVNLLLT